MCKIEVQKAILNIKALKEDYWDDDGYGHETEAYKDTMLSLDMAIEALEEKSCDDCISRADAVKTMAELEQEDIKAYGCSVPEGFDGLRAINAICALKSVQPRQKTGCWFVDERPGGNRDVVCSNCEQPIFKYHKLDFDYRPKYCPNCGTKMEG